MESEAAYYFTQMVCYERWKGGKGGGREGGSVYKVERDAGMRTSHQKVA